MPCGYINVYRSGFWHKAGKAGAFDRHAGDIYPDSDSAVDAIEQPHLYVATVPVQWEDEDGLLANLADGRVG